ncbi:MAG: hypothetical protein KF713_20465 [Turneriella sp.]|nr:hypothetical protein [Turneriella sp.]
MKWVWTIIIGLVGWLVYDWWKGKKGPVSDEITKPIDSMAEIADGIIEKEKVKKRMKWLWIFLGVLPIIGGGLWFFLRKKKPMNNLYSLGYLGMKAPAGFEQDARYLAGVAKATRERLKLDFAKTQGASVAGLPIESVQANFGKRRYYNESYK